jgi:hypothetical protein
MPDDTQMSDAKMLNAVRSTQYNTKKSNYPIPKASINRKQLQPILPGCPGFMKKVGKAAVALF